MPSCVPAQARLTCLCSAPTSMPLRSGRWVGAPASINAPPLCMHTLTAHACARVGLCVHVPVCAHVLTCACICVCVCRHVCLCARTPRRGCAACVAPLWCMHVPSRRLPEQPLQSSQTAMSTALSTACMAMIMTYMPSRGCQPSVLLAHVHVCVHRPGCAPPSCAACCQWC